MSDDDSFMPPTEFFEHMAKDCHCCPGCEVEPPCDGCCAGGVCDHGHCTCDEDDEDPYDDNGDGP